MRLEPFLPAGISSDATIQTSVFGLIDDAHAVATKLYDSIVTEALTNKGRRFHRREFYAAHNFCQTGALNPVK
jgi:hypothetical protein